MFNCRSWVVCVVCITLLCGCANDFSGNRYDSANIGEVSKTDSGTVMSLRRVELKDDKIGVGTVLGAVGGGLVGSAFGGGNAKFLTAAAGAVAGGAAGHAIENKAQDGIEYTIKLDTGAVVTIAQGVTPQISVGQRVRVINSNKGKSRVVPE
ncbi:MAG: glycine zipper 2TM domain-containing protein [Holosporales bacterium]|jgi:outer membrane lipoprotein SlyB|nr:glycine zipper 2TM domain-containing protein [Holosporales bacterium]